MNSIDFILPHNLSSALGWMVLHVFWQASAIGIATGLLLNAMRRMPARSRYWVANAALGAILVAALGTFIYYYEDAPPVPANGPAIVPASGLAAHPAQTGAALSPAMDTPFLGSAVLSGYFNRHLPLIVALWSLGLSLFLLRLLGNIGYVCYLKNRLNFPAEEYWQELLDQLVQKSGLSKKIRLVESALVRTPMVLGYFKPLILFPIGMINRLDPREAEAILAHELAHVLRHDYLFNILQSIVEALFYFHPAVWWLSGTVRHEREVAADDMAIRLTGNPMTYAKTLVLVQDAAFVPVSLSPAFSGARKNRLLERVQHVLNVQQSKSLSMEKIIATCCILLIIIGIGYTQTRNTTTVTEQPAHRRYPTARAARGSGRAPMKTIRCV
ncbi:MAG: M48 family metalloprotease [Lewinellaceae bacterium]|nr:M48 family metalloprotease [Lewinellaceae bacterium]